MLFWRRIALNLMEVGVIQLDGPLKVHVTAKIGLRSITETLETSVENTPSRPSSVAEKIQSLTVIFDFGRFSPTTKATTYSHWWRLNSLDVSQSRRHSLMTVKRSQAVEGLASGLAPGSPRLAPVPDQVADLSTPKNQIKARVKIHGPSETRYSWPWYTGRTWPIQNLLSFHHILSNVRREAFYSIKLHQSHLILCFRDYRCWWP